LQWTQSNIKKKQQEKLEKFVKTAGENQEKRRTSQLMKAKKIKKLRKLEEKRKAEVHTRVKHEIVEEKVQQGNIVWQCKDQRT